MPKPKVSTKSKVDKEKVNQIKNSAERKQIVKEAKVKAVQNRNARQFAPIEEAIPTITPFDVAKVEQMNDAINLKLLGTDSAKYVDEAAKAQRVLDDNWKRVQNTDADAYRVDALKGYGFGDSISTLADNSFVPTLDKRYQVAGLGDPKLPKTTHQATDQLFTEHPEFSSDEELIDYYESIPNYNPFQRVFKKYDRDENGNLVDMDERTNTKQALNAQYNQAINRRNLQTLYNAGLTDEDILYFNNAILRSPKGTKEKDILSDPRMLAIDSKIKASGLSDKEWSEVFEEYEQPYMKEFIKEHPVTAVLARTGANPVESIANVASNTGNYFTGNPLEQGRNTAGLVDSTLTADMNGVEKLFYGVGTSILDMETAMALSGGLVPFSASLMGVEKASDTMNDAIERGLNPNQIMAESVASGVTTALTEAIPMNKWEEIARKGLTTSIKDGAKFLKELSTVIAAGAFPEATQEGLENIADTLADAYIAGDKSKINLQIAELEASGMNRGEAARKVWLSWLIETGLDALAGGISGGAMTAGRIAIGNLNNPKVNAPTKADLNPLNGEITNKNVNNSDLDPQAYGLNFIPGDYKDALRNKEITREEVISQSSPQFQDVLKRLANDQNVTEDEIMALPEIQYAQNRFRQEQINAKDPSRLPYQQKLADDYYKRGSARFDKNGKVVYDGDVKKEKKVFFVMGLPASGKSSTLVDKISNYFGARVLDSDDIKFAHEDFDNGFGSHYIHPESKEVLKMVQKMATDNGENLVIPIIGGNKPDDLAEKIKMFQDAGWEVGLTQNDLPSNKSLGRALTRYLTDGRYIPPEVLIEYGDTPHSNYYEMIERGEKYGLKELDGFARVNNDVNAGEAAITEEYGGNLAIPELFGEINEGMERSNSESILGRRGRERVGLASTVNNENNVPQMEQSDETASFNSALNYEVPHIENTEIENAEMPRIYHSETVTEGDLSADDIRERGYSDTIKNKTDVPEELKSQFIDNPSLYRQLHNKDTQAMADSIFDSYELNDALSMCNTMISRKDPASVPLAHRISKALVEQGRMDDAVTLTNSLAQSLTEAGQFTQAVVLNMLNDNPVAALTYIEREIDALNNGGREQFGDKWNDFELTEEERQMFADIKDGDTDAINDAYAFVYSRIAREYPVSMLDKIYEAVRVGLLCNMRTFIRNLVGNTAMLPTRWTAGRVTALAEWAYAHKNKNYVRTEHGLGKISKESKDLAKSIYDERHKELFGTDEVKWREISDVLRNKQVFKGSKLDKVIDKGATWVAKSGIKLTTPVLKYLNNTTNGALQKICDIYNIGDMESLSDVLNNKFAHRKIDPSVAETVRNFTYYMLGELGDEPFIKANFVQKLSSYIEQNNITSAEELPQDAILLATQEANKATFHDNSSIAKGLEDLRHGFNKVGEELGVKKLGDFIVMFARTPGNIGSRMLEYSPYGLAKATVNAVKSNKAIQKIEGRMNEINNDLENNEHTTGETQKLQKELKGLKKESDSAYYAMTQALTLLGQGATGTLGVILGWILRKNGFIFGGLSNDKKEKAYQKDVQGLQENSVKIGNYSYSIDFLNALSPIIFGAVACEAFSENDGDFVETCKKAGVSVADAWINSTPLQNVAKVFDGYGSTAENVVDTILNIPTMGVPSQVGAIARIGDRTVRNAYDPTSTVNTIKNNIVAKIPGLSKTLPASYDAWGREKERQNTTGAAMFAQLINPGTTKASNPTDIDADILDLYNNMDRDTRVLPKAAENSYKIGDETFKLDNKQKSDFQRIMGENSYELAKLFINSDAWETMSDETKAETLNDMYQFSEALAKTEVLGKTPSTYKNLIEIYNNEGIQGVLKDLTAKNLLKSGGIQSNSAAGRELLQLDNLSVDDVAKVTGITADEQLASQQKIADEIPTLDTSLIMSSNGNWVNPETAIPYLDSLGLDDATQGEILYNNGKRSQKEINAFNDMGGYEGVKRYYDIKEYGMTHNTTSVTKDETIVYLESLGLTADEINDWLSVYGWKPDYTG